MYGGAWGLSTAADVSTWISVENLGTTGRGREEKGKARDRKAGHGQK